MLCCLHVRPRPSGTGEASAALRQPAAGSGFVFSTYGLEQTEDHWRGLKQNDPSPRVQSSSEPLLHAGLSAQYILFHPFNYAVFAGNAFLLHYYGARLPFQSQTRLFLEN